MDNHSSIITEVCNSRQQKFKYNGVDPGFTVIDRILHNVYNAVPSKQLLMPYAVYVYGPNAVQAKKIISDYSGFRPPSQIPHLGSNFFIEECPYVLLFTARQKNSIDLNPDSNANLDQNTYGIGRSDDTKTFVEIGMFLMLASMYAKCEGLDVSFCNCLNTVKIQQKLDLPYKIFTSLSIGYSVPIEDISDPFIRYRHNSYKKEHFPTRAYRKPVFENVVNYM